MVCHWLIQVKIAHTIVCVDTVGEMPSLPAALAFLSSGNTPNAICTEPATWVLAGGTVGEGVRDPSSALAQ